MSDVLRRARQTHAPIKAALQRIGEGEALDDADAQELFAAKDLEAEALRVMRQAAWPQYVLSILAKSFAGDKRKKLVFSTGMGLLPVGDVL